MGIQVFLLGSRKRNAELRCYELSWAKEFAAIEIRTVLLSSSFLHSLATQGLLLSLFPSGICVLLSSVNNETSSQTCWYYDKCSKDVPQSRVPLLR